MQLVELQRNVFEKQATDVAVMAVSYDPVQVLADFGTKNGIKFPLLSDVGSRVMGELGLLNPNMPEETGYWGFTYAEKHQGLPYPGTFLLDNAGVVVDKVFERSHRVRMGGNVLLDRLGLEARGGGTVATASGPAVTAAAWADVDEYFPNQVMRLTIRLAVEDGFHIYVPPNPSGFTELMVDIPGQEDVYMFSFPMPAGHAFSVEGFTEAFTVAEGDIEVVVPFYVQQNLEAVTIPIRITYQACNDTICLPPVVLDLALDLREIRA
ncbi:MAG: redoxin domain-containing protein [Acidimicrobiia bacterium]|nr:redoxin domain-containing protein [Acidimicrobiia bacterium]